MGCHRLARPYRAHFARSLIANRKDEIEIRCAGCGEFIPGLGPQIVRPKVRFFQHRYRQGIHRPRRVTACAECAEASLSPMLHEPLRHNAARGIAGAKKKEEERFGIHEARLRRTLSVVAAAGVHWAGKHLATSPPQQFSVKKAISAFMAWKLAA